MLAAVATLLALDYSLDEVLKVTQHLQGRSAACSAWVAVTSRW